MTQAAKQTGYQHVWYKLFSCFVLIQVEVTFKKYPILKAWINRTALVFIGENSNINFWENYLRSTSHLTVLVLIKLTPFTGLKPTQRV